MSDFIDFLDDSMAFYIDLIVLVDSIQPLADRTILLSLQGPFTASITSHLDTTRVSDIIYRSLIYLGDLARYKQLHSVERTKRWKEVRKFYFLARCVRPQNGNAYNQLAVIDTYLGRELEAIDMYTRSLVVERPFKTALDNLCILLKRSGPPEKLFMKGLDMIIRKESSAFDLFQEWLITVRKGDITMNHLERYLVVLAALVYLAQKDVDDLGVETVKRILRDFINVLVETFVKGKLEWLRMMKLVLRVVEAMDLYEKVDEMVVRMLTIVEMLRKKSGCEEQTGQRLKEDEEWAGCAFLDLPNGELVRGIEDDLVLVRYNQIIEIARRMCDKNMIVEKKFNGSIRFMTKVDESLWRGSSSDRSPLTPLSGDKVNQMSSQSKRSNVEDESDDLNTLSFLGLGSPPLAKFTIPNEFVKRSVKKATYPIPIGNLFTSSRNEAQTQQFEQLFQNPFAPSDIPRDPLFSRLTSYQQSMVSPIWDEISGNKGYESSREKPLSWMNSLDRN